MPALVNSKVGSLRGTNEELGIILCSLFWKKLRNACLSSSPVTYRSPSWF